MPKTRTREMTPYEMAHFLYGALAGVSGLLPEPHQDNVLDILAEANTVMQGWPRPTDAEAS